MNERLDIVTVDGNRKPGDRAIWFYFKKIGFLYKPYLKDLFYWMQLKGKVETNNYPPEKGLEGKEYLRKFLNAAIDGMDWEEADKKFQFKKKMD